MKTAKEFLEDNINKCPWGFINAYPITVKSKQILKDWFIKVMEEYASQRESKYKELYEAMKELMITGESIGEFGYNNFKKFKELNDKIADIEKELNLK